MATPRAVWQHILAVAAVLLSVQTYGAAQADPPRQLTVFAAASLTDAFRAVGRSFERDHPETAVVFNFAGSQQLARQIVEGADADLFASASTKQLRPLVDAKLLTRGSVRIFAHNMLVIVTPQENSSGIESIDDLARPGVQIVLADSSVPAGQYALQFLDKSSSFRRDLSPSFKERVMQNVVSYEENVRAVLTKATLGECDAGIVYTSDVSGDTLHRVHQVPIPADQNIVSNYAVCSTSRSRQPQIADEFIRFLLSDEGQRILQRFGFQPAREAAK
jgi:molybdate transport system substrate-binding protein